MPAGYDENPYKTRGTQVTRSQSPMSSTVIDSASRAHGYPQELAHPHSNWSPDSRPPFPLDSRSRNLSPHSGSQLPSPEGLLAGVPSSAASSYGFDSRSAGLSSQNRIFLSGEDSNVQPPLPPPSLQRLPSAHFEQATALSQSREHSSQYANRVEGTISNSERTTNIQTGQHAQVDDPRHSALEQGQAQHTLLQPRLRHSEPHSGPMAEDSRGRRLAPAGSAIDQSHRPEEWPLQNENRPASATIPNLLRSGREEALATISFKLVMRQQPQAARACGFGDRDRRVIDPPPIVELVIESPSLSKEEIQLYLRYESYVMNCSIFDETGTRDASYMPEEYQHQRRLMGSLVGTPFVGLDERGKEGCFFCFSDLSCRTPGAFCLKFTLIMIDPSRAGVVRHFPILTETYSAAFNVYSAKEFPGMMASSDLAKRLKEQGCIISIKKGNERSRAARGQDGGSDNDD